MRDREQIAVLKVPLSVSKESEEILDGQSRICNWLYNHLLEHANALREEYCKTQNPEIVKVLYTKRGLRDLIPTLKKENPFLKVVYSAPLKNAALRLSASIQTYQKSRRVKLGKKSGWPSFRSWKRNWFSLLYDEPNKGYRIQGNRLILSLGMGMDRRQRHLEVFFKETKIFKDKEIRNLRIVKQEGVFYAVFTVRVIVPELKKIEKALALDPNHKNLAYGVGTDEQAIEISSPSWLKKIDKRIDECISKRDRCKKRSQKIISSKASSYWIPSRRWAKFNRLVERLRRKRREQTKTFLFTIAQALFKRYDLVAIGDYTPDGTGETKQMRRAMNNQSLIGRFKDVLSWVSLKSGKRFYEYDEKGTTRTCHVCGYVVEGGLSPEIREWECDACTSSHIRDENAAKNGLKKVLRDLTLENLVPGSGLVLHKRWAWCARPSGVFTTLRGQCSDNVAAPRNSTKDMIVLDQNI